MRNLSRLVLLLIVALCATAFFRTRPALMRSAPNSPALPAATVSAVLANPKSKIENPKSDYLRIAKTPDGFAPVMDIPKLDPNSHWKNPAKPVEPVFPKNFSAPVRVRSGVADVKAVPLNANPDSIGEIAADGTLIYKNAFVGCDVQYRCTPLKTEEFIVVREGARDQESGARTADNSKLKTQNSKLSFSWSLDSAALTPRLTPAHTIELCDQAKVPRLRINAPEGKDANGKLLRAGGRLTLKLDGKRVTLSANLDGCAFPVVIDPTWSSTGAMALGRYGHNAVLLKNGKVLVCLFLGDKSCELYDPTSGTWAATGSLTSRHDAASATLLSDGSVLVDGGNGASDGCERYDPTTGAWSATGSLITWRFASSILLDSGSVLAAGGNNNGTPLASCEVYDPVSGTWAITGSLTTTFEGNPIVRLTGGEILTAGGMTGGGTQSNIFSQSTFTWTSVGNLNIGRQSHTLTALPDGTALAVGGASPVSEIYSSQTNSWRLAAPMSVARYSAASVFLKNGLVLTTGGWTGTSNNIYATCETFDPAAGTWSPAGTMITKRKDHTANVLQNGTVLVTGGVSDAIVTVGLASCELYDPSTQPAISAIASPAVLLEGQSTPFSSLVTNPDRDALTYLWTFGDGTTSTDTNPTHAYTTAGVYTASVTISGNSLIGAPFSITSNIVTITVFHDSDRPTARFTSSDLNGFVGQPIGFDATFSTDPKNNIVSYSWDFGDGSPLGSGQAISRVYTAEGTYTVTLTIVDGDGLTDTTTLTMVILPASQAGMLNSNIKYSVSWNRSATNADRLSLTASVNVGSTPVAASTPLSLNIVGQTFTGSSATPLTNHSSPVTTLTTHHSPIAKFQIKRNTKKGAPKGSYSLKVSVSRASLGQAFALAGVFGTKSATAKIPIRLGIGASNFESGIPSSFKFGSNGKASGGGQGPK